MNKAERIKSRCENQITAQDFWQVIWKQYKTLGWDLIVKPNCHFCVRNIIVGMRGITLTFVKLAAFLTILS